MKWFWKIIYKNVESSSVSNLYCSSRSVFDLSENLSSAISTQPVEFNQLMVSESFNCLQSPFCIEPISYLDNSKTTTTDHFVDQFNCKSAEDDTGNRSVQRSLSMDFTSCIHSLQKSAHKSDGDLLNLHLWFDIY